MKELALTQAAALIAVVGFLSFAGGYAVTGGITRQVEQFVYGENIRVNLRIDNLGINSQVTVYKGMTPFDVLLRAASLETTYYPSFGSSIITKISGVQQSWVYKVNGLVPPVGMQDYQLRDGDNLEILKASW
ncbi:MAG: DUF4430 domain-containing protein [Candidatus Hadarchaeota archaeon]